MTPNGGSVITAVYGSLTRIRSSVSVWCPLSSGRTNLYASATTCGTAASTIMAPGGSAASTVARKSVCTTTTLLALSVSRYSSLAPAQCQFTGTGTAPIAAPAKVASTDPISLRMTIAYLSP